MARLHPALIGTDDHSIVLINMKVRDSFKQTFDKLIDRLNRLKSLQGNGILDSGIVGVKGDDIVHAHAGQLLQGQSAV